jgi:hypothetical protein
MQITADGLLLRSLPNPLAPAEIAGQRIHVGNARAGATLTVEATDTTWKRRQNHRTLIRWTRPCQRP